MDQIVDLDGKSTTRRWRIGAQPILMRNVMGVGGPLGRETGEVEDAKQYDH